MPDASMRDAASTNTTSAMPPVVATVVVRRTQRLRRLYRQSANMLFLSRVGRISRSCAARP